MRRRFISNKNSDNNIIRYTSSDGNVVIPFKINFGTSLVSNSYTDKGLMVFKSIVTSIGTSAFYYCESLTSIKIPNSVTSIDNIAFFGCSGLTSLTIPNSVTSIGYEAFGACSGLKSIEIPNSVASISGSAFNRCDSLTSIVVDADNNKYDSRNDCNAIIETTSNTLIAGCQNTIIPNSVTSIEEKAFQGCHGLESIMIPNSVTKIGNDVFRECRSLTSITIPNSVTSIGERAFEDCSGLTSVYIESTTPLRSLSSSAFNNNASNRKIYVPRASLNAYKTSIYWREYADAIEPYDF